MSTMRKPVEPIRIPPDYKPRALADQIQDVTSLLHETDADERRGRYHRDFASFRRYQLKSVLFTLQGLQAKQADREPKP